MIAFVNAKINLGLSITERRQDGYHNLETLFYPVGLYNGTPENPSPFCDILEVTKAQDPDSEDKLLFTGREINCEPEKNLVFRALKIFREELSRKDMAECLPAVEIHLDKHLPDGAGLGGGSADASFTLRMLNETAGSPFSKEELVAMALRLGADCPFFIINRPAFASGVGECLELSRLDLSGWWALIIKPEVYVSTREAFSGITPAPASFDLRRLAETPVSEWKKMVRNDFESTIFPLHPQLREIKENLYRTGAVYASMSGSGSSLFGLFPDRMSAEKAYALLSMENPAIYLIKL